MAKNFTAADLTRLQEAEAEKWEMALFINERFRQFAALTNVEGVAEINARSTRRAFPVANLLAPKMVKNVAGQEIEVFILEDGIGGDHWGSDYDLYYVPTEFVFDKDGWTKKYLEAVNNGWAYVPIAKGSRHSSR